MFNTTKKTEGYYRPPIFHPASGETLHYAQFQTDWARLGHLQDSKTVFPQFPIRGNKTH